MSEHRSIEVTIQCVECQRKAPMADWLRLNKSKDVCPNCGHDHGEDAAVRSGGSSASSAAAVAVEARQSNRERLGWSKLSDAQKARNLAHNCPWL